MSIHKKKIFCVIPAWNEELNITKTLENVILFTDKIIVVDDGSTDSTLSLVNDFAQKTNIGNKKIIALSHVINRGQGAALATGNELALSLGADIIFHFDADGQFLSTDINKILEPLLFDDFDAVFGSRFLGLESEMPFSKKNIIMPIARLFMNFFFKAHLTDPQSGFRALNRKAWKKIDIEQDGMAHCSEIIIKVLKNNLRVKEVPIRVLYNEYGLGASGGVRIIKDLFLRKIS